MLPPPSRPGIDKKDDDMRAVIQRVHWAQVEVQGQVVGRIEQGLLVYVGIGVADSHADAQWLAEKTAHLRVFPDSQGRLNVSVQDARGGVLAISNFTLMGDARKGRRPSFDAAAPAEKAGPLHEAFLEHLRQNGCAVATGVFGAEMIIRSAAAGPVNIIIDSDEAIKQRPPAAQG